MPSPIGHALGGLAAGWLIAGDDRADAPGAAARALLFAAAGVAADLDLLLGTTHRGASHSLAAACITGLVVYGLGFHQRLALAVAAAYATHPALDALGQDTTPPFGVMVLWPFSREFFDAGFALFDAISRRYWLPGFWKQNILAVARELAILGPLAVLGYFNRRRWGK